MPIQKGPANLGAGSVDSTELSNTLDLSAKTVTYRTIVAGDIASNAITTAKIADANITPAKMANSGAELGMRNRIINGAMVIDQRNAGASVTPASSAYTLDRWLANLTAASKFSVVQSTVAPAGFTNSVLITSTSAYSIVAGDYNTFQQRIEANNMMDAGWGTSSAQTFTLSFWVRSSLTGTFGGSLYFPATTTRTFPFSYVINSANTWEQKTITITGDTTSNTAPTTNNLYVIVQWGLGVGSTYTTATTGWQNGNFASPTGCTNLIATNGATFYITGVQLEKGSTATSFDYRPYGTEFSLCQRYFQRRSTEGVAYGQIATGGLIGSNTLYQTVNLLQTMRVAPSMSSSAANTFSVDPGNTPGTSIAFERMNANAYRINVATAGNANSVGQLFANNTATAYIDASAEL